MVGPGPEAHASEVLPMQSLRLPFVALAVCYADGILDTDDPAPDGSAACDESWDPKLECENGTGAGARPHPRDSVGTSRRSLLGA
jgi:hypothetical protein